MTHLYQHGGWLKIGIVEHLWRFGLRGQVGFLPEGGSFCSQVLVVFFFVLHWKRGRAGSFTLRRARIVTSTITGMTAWPWHQVDLNQS